MALDEAMLLDMYRSQIKTELKLDQLIEASRMEEMEDMMEDSCKKAEHEGTSMEMDGGLESMLGAFMPDMSTLG